MAINPYEPPREQNELPLHATIAEPPDDDWLRDVVWTVAVLVVLLTLIWAPEVTLSVIRR